MTGRAAGLTAFGAVVVGLLLPTPTGVLVVAAVVAGLLVVDVAAAAPIRPLRWRRTGPTSVTLGSSATLGLEVENPGRRRLRGTVRDAWTPSAGVGPQRFAVDVPAGQTRLLTSTLTPTRRGDRRSAQVSVRSIGPLGLAGRQGDHAVPWTVRALPPFRARRHLPSRLARLRELDGRSALMVRGAGTEFDALREYVPGDDVRSIDWRASARSPELVVRTWRPERDRHVLIVLDTGRSSAGRVGSAPRLDASMDAALLLAVLAGRAGDRVDLLAHDRVVRAGVERPAPGQTLPRLVSALATLEPELLETDHRALAAEIARRAGRHACVVLLTGLDEASVDEGLLPVLPALLRRHTVVVAAVDDPRLHELAGRRGDTGQVYAAAAAEQDLAGRRRAAERLRRAGVHVVDATPDDLPPALADAYLDLKATGRL